jgi:hypothetical protein
MHVDSNLNLQTTIMHATTSMNTRKVSVVGDVGKTRFQRDSRGVLVASLQKMSSPALVNHVVIKFSPMDTVFDDLFAEQH